MNPATIDRQFSLDYFTYCTLVNVFLCTAPLAQHGYYSNYIVIYNNNFSTDGIAFISFRVLSTSTATYPRRNALLCCCSASLGYRHRPSRRVVTYPPPLLLPPLLQLRPMRKGGRRNNSNNGNCSAIYGIIRNILISWRDAIPRQPVDG